MDKSQPPAESPVDSTDPPPSPSQMWGDRSLISSSPPPPGEQGAEERDAEENDAEEQSDETSTVAATARGERDEHRIQGDALRSLISNLISEKDLTQVNRHQASTLSQLVHIKQGLATINKRSLDAYNDSVADFMKATRLVGQIKQNLDDISRRLAFLNKTLQSSQTQQTASQPPE